MTQDIDMKLSTSMYDLMMENSRLLQECERWGIPVVQRLAGGTANYNQMALDELKDRAAELREALASGVTVGKDL